MNRARSLPALNRPTRRSARPLPNRAPASRKAFACAISAGYAATFRTRFPEHGSTTSALFAAGRAYGASWRPSNQLHLKLHVRNTTPRNRRETCETYCETWVDWCETLQNLVGSGTKLLPGWLPGPIPSLLLLTPPFVTVDRIGSPVVSSPPSLRIVALLSAFSSLFSTLRVSPFEWSSGGNKMRECGGPHQLGSGQYF